MFWKENKWTSSPSRPSVFPHKDKPSADRMESLQVTCLCFWANIQNTWVGLWISHRVGTCVYGSIFLFWCSSRGRGGVFLKCFMSYISSHPRSQSSKKETARRIWRRMGSPSLRESSVLVETEKEHARYYRYYRIVDCATLLISFAHFLFCISRLCFMSNPNFEIWKKQKQGNKLLIFWWRNGQLSENSRQAVNITSHQAATSCRKCSFNFYRAGVLNC